MSAFTLGEVDVQPGQRATVDLPVSTLSKRCAANTPANRRIDVPELPT